MSSLQISVHDTGGKTILENFRLCLYS